MLLVVLASIVVLILILQVAISPIAQSIVNRRLSEMPGFTGHVDSLKVALWRGSMDLKGFVLHERGQEQDLPLVRAEKLSARMEWTALLRGRLRGAFIADGVETTFVKRTESAEGEEEKKQKGPIEQAGDQAKQKAEPWREALRRAIPIEVSRFEVKNGKTRFVDRSQEVPVDVSVEQLHLLVTGLSTDESTERFPAKLELTGITTGGGRLKVTVQAAPMAKPVRFAATMALENQQLPPLNSLLLAYAKADVSRGVFEFYVEVNVDQGRYEGYTKPFLKDVDFKTVSDKDKSVVQRVAKSAVNAAVNLLENKDDNKVATKAPFSGNLEANDVDVWTAVVSLLRNAFVQALREGFERGG